MSPPYDIQKRKKKDLFSILQEIVASRVNSPIGRSLEFRSDSPGEPSLVLVGRARSLSTQYGDHIGGKSACTGGVWCPGYG